MLFASPETHGASQGEEAMKTLSTSFLRNSAEALGFQLIKRYPGCYDLRDGKRLYFKNAPRSWIARFLLEAAVEAYESGGREPGRLRRWTAVF
jgi:hypothetical protein